MSTLQARLYWALIGILFGVGAVATFSVGVPLMLLAVAMVSYATIKGLMRPDPLRLWIVLVTLGLAAMSVLISDYVMADHSTDFFTVAYWVGVLLFGAVSLVGIVGGAIMMLRRQRQT